MTFPTHAKINLGLQICERRPDGYHNIETVFHRINLYDEITLERSGDIRAVTTRADVPADEGNICYKAAEALRNFFGTTEGVTISIKKNIPVGAGLGGGSANAGGVLRNLPVFWGQSIRDPELQNIALQLGSDVPYFLGSGTAFAHGRGELLEYFTLDVPYIILVCFPNIHVSTAWAYRTVSLRHAAARIDLKKLLRECMHKPQCLVDGLRNDFEAAVFKEWPEISRVKEAMMHGGAEYASMSGSGSAMFGFFSNGKLAAEMEATFHARGYQTSLTMPHFRPDQSMLA